MSFESIIPSSPVPSFIPLSGGSHQQQNHNAGLGWLYVFSSRSVPSSGQATAIQIPTCPMSSASVAVHHLELEGPLIDQLGQNASTAVQSACCLQLSVSSPLCYTSSPPWSKACDIFQALLAFKTLIRHVVYCAFPAGCFLSLSLHPNGCSGWACSFFSYCRELKCKQ